MRAILILYELTSRLCAIQMPGELRCLSFPSPPVGHPGSKWGGVWLDHHKQNLPAKLVTRWGKWKMTPWGLLESKIKGKAAKRSLLLSIRAMGLVTAEGRRAVSLLSLAQCCCFSMCCCSPGPSVTCFASSRAWCPWSRAKLKGLGQVSCM